MYGALMFPFSLLICNLRTGTKFPQPAPYTLQSEKRKKSFSCSLSWQIEKGAKKAEMWWDREMCQYNSVIKKPFHFLKSFQTMRKWRSDGGMSGVDIARQAQTTSAAHKSWRAFVVVVCLSQNHSQLSDIVFGERAGKLRWLLEDTIAKHREASRDIIDCTAQKIALRDGREVLDMNLISVMDSDDPYLPLARNGPPRCEALAECLMDSSNSLIVECSIIYDLSQKMLY